MSLQEPAAGSLWSRFCGTDGSTQVSGQVVSQRQLKFGDPNATVQMTANSEAACMAGGTVAAQPVPALLWWVGIL